MDTKYSLHLTDQPPVQVVAQAYGIDSYSSNTYNGQPVTSIIPGVPNTGFFAEPPIVILPTLLAIAVVVGTISFLITRAVRRRRSGK